MEAAESCQVMKTDLHYSIVLEEDGLQGRRQMKLAEWSHIDCISGAEQRM